ncbi:MAG: autotransporter domain-containing protein [Polyangiaceae bacterium]|nr:autotransporter domain-containing protein [Polyangiaceae bacterium]MCW5791756.1 autotransporter domain-containing protein [Polyangiaceae bacterium]
MSPRPSRALILAALLGAPWFVSAAAAEQPPAAVATDDDAEPEEEDEQALPIIPFAADERGGRFMLTLEGQLGLPLGGGAFSDLGVGPGGALTAGYAVHHSVSLGLWGAYQGYAAPSECDGCASTASTSLGLDVTYYLVQGLRLDPWARFGAGYVRTAHDVAGEEVTSQGVGLRLSLGADWRVAGPALIGPYAGLDVTPKAFTSTEGDAATTWALHFGLRVRFAL